MRITLVTDWWLPRIGGIETQLADLAAALAARGHAVRVLTTTDRPTVVPGVDVDRICLPMTGDIAAPDLRRVADITECIASGSPDLVHAHGMFSSLAIGGIMAARRLGIPSVSTTHSLLRPWPVLVGARILSRLLSHTADIATAVSAAVARDVARVAGRLVLRIPNGLNVNQWRTERRPSNDGIHILAIARLVRKKSPGDLIAALHEALRRVGPRRVRMTIAGDGPERPRLERDARRLGVSAYLTFLGSCTRAEVRRLLAEASMLAHPGRHEAFGLALLEARAAGVPVVAMASGGVPELVEHGRHGLLAKDARSFATDVAELATNDTLRGRCADQAPLGLERFDWRRVTADYEAVYALAMDRGNSRRRARQRPQNSQRADVHGC